MDKVCCYLVRIVEIIALLITTDKAIVCILPYPQLKKISAVLTPFRVSGASGASKHRSVDLVQMSK